MRIFFPQITHISLLSGTQISAESSDDASVILIEHRGVLDTTLQTQIREWLHTRLHDATFNILFQATAEVTPEILPESDTISDSSV